MYELDLIFKAAIAINRIHAAASATEKLAYRADDWFQENVVPWGWMAIVLAISGWAMAILATIRWGRLTGDWFKDWFAGYVVEAIVPMVEAPQLAIVGVQIAGYLPPARELRSVVGKSRLD